MCGRILFGRTLYTMHPTCMIQQALSLKNWNQMISHFEIKPCWIVSAIEWEQINIFRFRKKYFVEKRCTIRMIYVKITQD